MSSEIKHLDKLNTHIGGKRTVKAKIKRNKNKRLKIIANALAFERSENEEKDNNYFSPPPELPIEFANIGSSVNSSLPRNPVLEASSWRLPNNGNLIDSNVGSPPSPPGPPGAPDSSISDFQATCTPGSYSDNGLKCDAPRLSMEEIKKIRKARRAEEEAKAKAKAKEEDEFMKDIESLVETGNRGSARGNKGKTAKRTTEFEKGKKNDSGESVMKQRINAIRGEQNSKKSTKINLERERRQKALITGDIEPTSAANLDLMNEAPTKSNFVTTTQPTANGPAISTEDYNFSEFRGLLSILNNEQNNLFKEILKLIKEYGILVNQTGGDSALSDGMLVELSRLLNEGAKGVSRSSQKLLRSLDLKHMTLRLFKLTKLGRKTDEVILLQSFVPSNVPTKNLKAPNIQTRPAEYRQVVKRIKPNGSVASSGMSAYTTLTEGGPAEPFKNHLLSKGNAKYKNKQQEAALKFVKANEKQQNLGELKFSKNDQYSQVTKDRKAKEIIFKISKSSNLTNKFKEFRKSSNKKGSELYLEFAKNHPQLISSKNEINSALPVEINSALPVVVETSSKNEMQIPLKQLSRNPVPLLEVDFSSSGNDLTKKLSKILSIVEKHELLHKYKELLETKVTSLTVESVIDDLYKELRKYDELASLYPEFENYQRETLDRLLKEKYPTAKTSSDRKKKLSLMKDNEHQEIRLQLAELNKPFFPEINRSKSGAILKQIQTETEKLSRLDKLTERRKGQTLEDAHKKRVIDFLMKKYSLTPKPGVVYEADDLDALHKELVDMDILASEYPQFSRTQREDFNSFLQSRYPQATSIQNRITKKTKTNIENFIKSQSAKRRERIFKQFEEYEQLQLEENKKRRAKLTEFAKAPNIDLTNKSFAKATKVDSVTASNKVSPITAPKPLYATSNNKQQELNKIEMIVEEILKIEQLKGSKNPSRLSMIEKIKKSRLNEDELLDLYNILAGNLDLLSEVNTRYKFEIKKLLKKINDKKYTKIIKDIEKSIKNQLNRSRMPNVSSPTESPVESSLELSAVDPTESRAESPAESHNNSSVNKILSNSELNLKILKKNTLKIEKELLEKKREKEKLEKELDSILKLTNKTNISKNMKAIISEIEKLEKEISEKVKLEKQTTKRRNLEKIKSEIEKLKTKLSEKNKEKINLEKKLANKLNSIWKNSSKQMRNPRTIQSEIEKSNRSIKLLESSLEKILNKIYDEFLNNLKGAKKALEIIRTNMTNNKNELNEYKKINRFEEIMKELYELFNDLVKKYKFDGEKIQQNFIDNLKKYKELIYQRKLLHNNNRPPKFPEEALSIYA